MLWMTPTCCWVTVQNIAGRHGNVSTISNGEEFLIAHGGSRYWHSAIRNAIGSATAQAILLLSHSDSWSCKITPFEPLNVSACAS